jgi:tetratricopeptide (TPR) repeat protein
MIGRITVAAVGAMALSLTAFGQYAARVELNAGNSFVVKQLNIKNDRLYRDAGESSTAVPMIRNIEIRFTTVSLAMCDKMFRSGDLKALESILLENVQPLARHSHLSENLNVYLVWLVRVQYWNGNPAGATAIIKNLRSSNKPVYVDTASLYFTLLLLDQGKIDNAESVFASVADPDSISHPMAEYIRGRFAFVKGDYREAMQRAAEIVAFHALDAEWMAPATALEAETYLKMGRMEKAAAVAEELMLAYPGTSWSRAGERIKMETTGKHGG